jgi:hypothetical protein
MIWDLLGISFNVVLLLFVYSRIIYISEEEDE